MDHTPQDCEALRAKLKEFGLEHAVRLMSVEERGEARRLIRDALKVYAETLRLG